ncbi:MAG: GtrA family protein [Candidatus Peregrinibacteria bacterium]
MRDLLRRHARPFLLYFLSGGIAAVVDFGGFTLLVSLGLWYFHASLLSSIAAFFTTFFLNKIVVFRKKGATVHHLLRFALVDLTNSAVSNLLLYGMVSGIGFEPYFGKIIAMGIVVSWNYFIYRFFVYA